jgi:hypothetical protein
MKAIILQVRDSMCEDGSLCDLVMNTLIITAFGGVMAQSIVVLS